MSRTTADMMIETHLSLVTQNTHAHVTDGVDSIEQEIMEYCGFNFEDESENEFIDLEGEELLSGYIATLDRVIKRYNDKFDLLRSDYAKAIVNLGQNPKAISVADVFLHRDLSIMNHVIIELEALRDTFIAKEDEEYDIDTLEEYLDYEIEDTMKIIDKKVQHILKDVGKKLKEIENE